MDNKMTENIYRLVVDYKTIFTTIYVIKTPKGVMIFDAATYEEDINDNLVPLIENLGIRDDEIKYIFISHKHGDHAGGLEFLIKKFPNACILSRSEVIHEDFKDYSVVMPNDGDIFLDVLKVVTIPGHTKDSAGIFDMRDKTLVCGDSLQLYGIFGSGKWGANIRLPREHFQAIAKLRSMDIKTVLTAHDYYPGGYRFDGNDAITAALNNCIEPLMKVKTMVIDNPQKSDDEICEYYNTSQNVPTLGVHVVTAIRNMINEGGVFDEKN